MRLQGCPHGLPTPPSPTHALHPLRPRATPQSRRGLLHLVDLAGSERISKSAVNDTKAGGSAQLLKETQAINSSLSSA